MSKQQKIFQILAALFFELNQQSPKYNHTNQGRCKKNRINWDFVPNYGQVGVLNFLVKITIQLFLLQTSRNVLKHVIHKWGGHIWPFHDALRPQRWNFVRKISHFFKKIKCSKQPKKQNKLNFYFSLSGVPNVRGGWVGSDVWDKVPNKYVFFLHLP